VRGGFFLRKKPLEYVLSVYTNSENAVEGYPAEMNGGNVGCKAAD
jgi:hypothetical protein